MTNTRNKILPNVFLTLMTVLILGCASRNAADVTSHSAKRILDIIMNDNSESLILTIKGNQTLTYASDEQNNPKEILFYFPNTTLDGVGGLFIPPENEIISSIKVDLYVEGEATTSTILIALKKHSTYNVTSDKDDIHVAFAKRAHHAKDIEPQKDFVQNKSEPNLIQKSAPPASLLKTVTIESLENTMTVNVKADGTISNYKAFTMVEPNRIVFDLYNVKSPQRIEQKIAVQSQWVKRIRYFGHPDKLRLVIETHDGFQSNYESFPTPNGLSIQVGQSK